MLIRIYFIHVLGDELSKRFLFGIFLIMALVESGICFVILYLQKYTNWKWVRFLT